MSPQDGHFQKTRQASYGISASVRVPRSVPTGCPPRRGLSRSDYRQVVVIAKKWSKTSRDGWLASLDSGLRM